MNTVIQNCIIKIFCASFIEVHHYSKSNRAELSTVNIMIDLSALASYSGGHGIHFCACRVATLTGFPWFSSVPEVNAGVVPHTRAQPHHFTSKFVFADHCIV
jgi:hypothetical protein